MMRQKEVSLHVVPSCLGRTGLLCFVLLPLVFLALSCSSAPRRTMERTTVAESAYSRLELANGELSKGDFVSARNDINAAYNSALSIDNVDLLTKVCLTKVTLATTAVAGQNAEDAHSVLAEAEKYAARSTNAETLLAICSLYEARLILDGTDGRADDASLDKALAICNEIENKLEKQKQYLAYLYRTRGEIYLQKKNYAEAQVQFTAAAALHTKERYLSEIGMDWYLAAQSYLLDEKKAEAVKALNTALQYDRLDENTAGIGADYYGLAMVFMHGAQNEAEKKQALEYAVYSEKIYTAGGFTDYAKRSAAFIAEYAK